MRYVIVLFIFLLFRLIIFYSFPLPFIPGEQIHVTATLFENPTIKGSSQLFHILVGTLLQGAEVTVATNTDTIYQYGQELDITGTINSRLLKNKQTIITIQNAKIKAKNSAFLPLFGIVRQKIMSFCENNFSQPYSGLLVGIIFGEKSLLTDGITRSFRITGLSHVVAASGMNVTLVAGFLFCLFSLFLRRQEAIVCSIVGIFFYVCISGFEASIVRAALMGSLSFAALLLGRQYSALYILCVTGTVMLLWNPLLLGDVGFQLSFLATGGILLLKPLIFPSSFFFDDLATTLSAQIATLPIMLGVFGQYALVSIFANVLVLWTIPLIMIGGGIGIVIGLFFEPLGKLIIFIILPLIWYLQQVTYFFSNHPLAISLYQLPVFFLISYYFLLVGVVLFLKRYKKQNQEVTVA